VYCGLQWRISSLFHYSTWQWSNWYEKSTVTLQTYLTCSPVLAHHQLQEMIPFLQAVRGLTSPWKQRLFSDMTTHEVKRRTQLSQLLEEFQSNNNTSNSQDFVSDTTGVFFILIELISETLQHERLEKCKYHAWQCTIFITKINTGCTSQNKCTLLLVPQHQSVLAVFADWLEQLSKTCKMYSTHVADCY